MSKKVSKKEDTISQLKKEENKIKENNKKEEEESGSEEEEEEQNQNEIKEQTIQKSDKPKSLKELMNSIDSKPKPKPKKEQKKPKQKNNDEPKKMTFFNSKGLANTKSDSAAKENEKIKPTKNYTEKETKREYNEDVAKPKFKTNKEKGENFTELNKDEDVSIFKIIKLI